MKYQKRFETIALDNIQHDRVEQEPLLLISRQQAAELLGIRPQTLAVWAMKNIGPAPTKIGRCVRYRRDLILAYIAKNTMPREGGRL